ncbi:hypothetical protein B566_EDAN006208 [Ephemera danica]|nr:hypothetical protein B566_EDAN006208 [Ephemera danica]
MGNKLSCSCAPLIRKAYRYEDSPWQTSRRRDGHLLRLWAEVFHVSASGAGTVKWQQVSEDLVPVNITCIQDSPECVFHITAYNSQVDKILDVRLVQPGTRIGQASECFVYWKDPMTNDTWGLNFTSPIDAKQFRECCSPSFKFSRKASSSYSLRLEPPKQKVKAKRKPLSTPASPSRAREPQCTCMTAEQYARLRAQDPRYPTSSTSLYDNVSGPKRGEPGYGSMRQRERGGGGVGGNMQPPQQEVLLTAGTKPQGGQQNHVSQQQSVEVNQPPGTRQPPSGGNQPQQQMNHRQRGRDVGSMKQDYSDVESSREAELRHKRAKSKSTDDMTLGERGGGGGGGPGGGNISLDSNTLKRMLKPMPSMESPVTSPEMSRRRYGRHHHHHNHHHHHHQHPDMGSSFLSEPETSSAPNNHHRPNSAAATSRFSNSRSAHEFGRGLYLELERDRGDVSPPSDNVLFDNQCYATTPSSSNGNNSDMEPSGQPHNTASTPGSPTSRLLLEYEMHLRNTLAKGMDAESYSLHTFEALLTQSMENLESIVWNENNRHPHQHHHHHLHPNNSVNSHHNINNNQAASHHSHHHPNQPRQQQRPQLQRANSAVAAANASWWTNQQPSTASSSASSAGPTKPPSGRERQLQASLNELHHKYRTLACCSAAAAAAAASGRGAPTHKTSQSTRSIPGGRN